MFYVHVFDNTVILITVTEWKWNTQMIKYNAKFEQLSGNLPVVRGCIKVPYF